MATFKTAVVTTIDAGTVVRPSEYLGTAKVIPVSFTGDVAQNDIIMVSNKLSPNTYVTDVNITTTALGSGATLVLGYTGTTNAVIASVSVASAGTVRMLKLPVDVGGKELFITATGADWSAGSLTGTITVVQDQ